MPAFLFLWMLGPFRRKCCELFGSRSDNVLNFSVDMDAADVGIRGSLLPYTDSNIRNITDGQY
jgi:hypothetical protein